MHTVQEVYPGVWKCRECLALAVDGEKLAAHYLASTGEVASPEEMALSVAEVLASDLGNPIQRVDHFCAGQIQLMQGHPCPHNASAVGIPEGHAQVIVGGGVN